MKPNMASVGRSIRAIIGIAMILTAAIRHCPPYALLGINTDMSED